MCFSRHVHSKDVMVPWPHGVFIYIFAREQRSNPFSQFVAASAAALDFALPAGRLELWDLLN